MATPKDTIRPKRLRSVSRLETSPEQLDPQLREGRVGGVYKLATFLAIAFILGIVLYGLNAQRPEGALSASVSPASSRAPTGANQAAGPTTGQGGAQTTGQAAPMRDSSGAGVTTGESSGGQQQQSSQAAPDARASQGGNGGQSTQGGATQAPTNTR